jgi:hypothetical protein
MDLTPNGTQPRIPINLERDNFNCSKKKFIVSNIFNKELNSNVEALITFFDWNRLMYSLFLNPFFWYMYTLYTIRGWEEFEVESHSELSPFGVESQSEWVHSGLSPSRGWVYSEFSPFWVRSIWGSVHSGFSPFWVWSIRGSVQLGFSTFGVPSIRGSVHSGLGPFEVQSIRCSVHSRFSPFEDESF